MKKNSEILSLEFTRHQLFLDATNMGYSTDAVNFIIELYCPWNFHHVRVNHHLFPASFPDYLATVSKSNHLKLIKYNLQRRWYLDDGCYMIYLIILYKLVLSIYIFIEESLNFFKLKLIWYYGLWDTTRKANKKMKKILPKVVPLPLHTDD